MPGEPDPAEVAALADEGPHLVTSWGGAGTRHCRCCCGRGTPPAGVLTGGTAETFVAACRAAQALRDADGRSAGDRSSRLSPAARPSAAQGARTRPGAGDPLPESAQRLSGPRGGSR